MSDDVWCINHHEEEKEGAVILLGFSENLTCMDDDRGEQSVDGGKMVKALQSGEGEAKRQASKNMDFIFGCRQLIDI